MKINIIKSAYDWVLKWAERPSANYALFIFAFAESSFFPVPPDVLLIPLVLGYRKKWIKLFLIVTVASALGGSFGYFIGHKLWWSGTVPLTMESINSSHFTGIANFFFNSIPGFSLELFKSMMVKYEHYGFWIVFTAGFTPIPYKVFTISSGAFNLNFYTFMFASVVSRGARFFLVSFLIYRFGKPIKVFIDKYFNILALVFTILLIGGFLIIKSFT